MRWSAPLSQMKNLESEETISSAPSYPPQGQLPYRFIKGRAWGRSLVLSRDSIGLEGSGESVVNSGRVSHGAAAQGVLCSSEKQSTR